MDKRKKILIVDDDAAINDVLTNFIKANNFNVISTTKASLALKILKKEKIDLIITDINMPEMDGIEFIRKVRVINNEVKIIVITGFPSPDSQQEAYNLGALNYLIKPFSSERFKEIIDNTLKLNMKSGNVIGQVELSIEDLIQMYSMEKKSIVLTVQKGNKKGEIFIHNGVIVHAKTENNIGEKAFYEIILLKSGIFTSRPYIKQNIISIKNRTVESLLLNGARLQDEIDEINRIKTVRNSTRKIKAHIKKEEKMPSQAQEILTKASGNIDGLEAMSVIGMDGIPVANINPSNIQLDAFAAKYAIVTNLVKRSLAELKKGDLEEILIEHGTGWVFARLIGTGKYFLAINTTKNSVIGGVRLIARQIEEQLKAIVG